MGWSAPHYGCSFLTAGLGDFGFTIGYLAYSLTAGWEAPALTAGLAAFFFTAGLAADLTASAEVPFLLLGGNFRVHL